MLPEINKILYATDLSSGPNHDFRYALLGTIAHKLLHSCALPTLLIRIPE